jgi:hypothetical protein
MMHMRIHISHFEYISLDDLLLEKNIRGLHNIV